MIPARIPAALIAAAIGAAAGAPVHAAALLSGFGGPRDYGTEFLFRNDDEWTTAALPFTVDFFGQQYSAFHVNNNGNITFGAPLGNFTPAPFPLQLSEGEGEAAPVRIIAPYWSDVDTRSDLENITDNLVWVHSPNPNTVVVTWDQVGYFDRKTDRRNDFQLVLRHRPETGAGNFDIDFRYRRLEWTTGDSSQGEGGLGGIPAQAGFDAGDGIHYFSLPGSLTNGVLDLQHTSNVASDTPGLWTFAVRNGALPDGATPSNPLLPVVTDAGWQFEFDIEAGRRIFIDPLVAVGYDYIVDSGPGIASILLPGAGDGSFELWLWDGADWVDSGETLSAGIEHVFATAQRRLRILGIEVGANLDPTDPTAFVTGLTFESSGSVAMRQVAVTVAVPEPGTWAMLGLGLLLVRAGAGRVRAHRREAVSPLHG